MRKKYQITVCEKGIVYRVPGPEIEKITRVIWAEAIGNFNPFFCRYHRKKYLLQSREGDLSDPFRREESYADSFFIEIERKGD